MNASATMNQSSRGPRSAVERRCVIGSFGTFADAKRIVDRLSERRFGAGRSTTIVRDLSFVEHGTRPRAAFDRAARGALAGALIGLPLGLILFGAIAGALAGALLSLMLRAPRSESAARMEVAAYDVLVDEHLADDATRVLVHRGSRE